MTIKDGKDYIPQIRDLITEYARQLNRNLSFQNIEKELEKPAIKHTTPQGGTSCGS